MGYTIENVELFVRETLPGRMAFALGKQGAEKAEPLSNPLGHVRLTLRDSKGGRTFGCAGDRLSVRWLDKRPGRSREVKLGELVALIGQARAIYLAHPEFDTPFQHWRSSHDRIMEAGRARDQGPAQDPEGYLRSRSPPRIP